MQGIGLYNSAPAVESCIDLLHRYDTLDTLTTLSPDSLVDVEAFDRLSIFNWPSSQVRVLEAFNNVKWLPGHKASCRYSPVVAGEVPVDRSDFSKSSARFLPEFARAHQHDRSA